MKDLVDYIVKNIVSIPDKVEVEEQKEDSVVRVNLKVDPSDMGVVIGKNGQTIQALRRLLTVRAMAEGVKVYLNLIDPVGGAIGSQESQPDPPKADQPLAGADRPLDEESSDEVENPRSNQDQSDKTSDEIAKVSTDSSSNIPETKVDESGRAKAEESPKEES